MHWLSYQHKFIFQRAKTLSYHDALRALARRARAAWGCPRHYPQVSHAPCERSSAEVARMGEGRYAVTAIVIVAVIGAVFVAALLARVVPLLGTGKGEETAVATAPPAPAVTPPPVTQSPSPVAQEQPVISVPTTGGSERASDRDDGGTSHHATEPDAEQSAAPPEWEYATRLLDPDGDFSETTVDFQGDKRPNSLRNSLALYYSPSFFWKLADLPTGYKAKRLTATVALDDSSDADSAVKFEFRCNHGAPSSFSAKPGEPAEVSLGLDGIWRIDVTVFDVGEGRGTCHPIIVEPKLHFR